MKTIKFTINKYYAKYFLAYNTNMNANSSKRRRKPFNVSLKAPREINTPRKLAAFARSDLHSAGMSLFDFFETMINPEDHPPQRVPDSHAASSAVFKTPFVVDIPFSGLWDSSIAGSAQIDEEAPKDGYSEVILVPGTTDCIFYTLGVGCSIWGAVEAAGFEQIMVPVLASHPVVADVLDGWTQCIQGLRELNTDVDDVGILPKFDSYGHAIMECKLTPLISDQGTNLDILIGFHNVGITAATRTRARVTYLWNSGEEDTKELNISSTGDNNTLNSDFYKFQFTVPNEDDFVRAFYVEVSDVDAASQWKYSMTTPDTLGFALNLMPRSACAFAIVDAPELSRLSETHSERTTALTGLITYMGSDLANGGKISAARLGMGLSPLRATGGDVYSYLASLPFYNADFALKYGIYAWWLPDSIQEHFYVPYKNPRSDDLEFNSVLQYALRRDNPAQSLRLKVIQNLEVITRSRLYTTEAGPNNPAYSSIVAAVKAIPAITINANHLSFLGKAFNSVKGWVSKPANWIKLLTGGTALISQLAPGIGPVIGPLANALVNAII
jgi:hypothetical protein